MKRVIGVISLAMCVVFIGASVSFGYAAPSAAVVDTKTELKSRLDERRIRLKTKLTPVESTRIKGRCVAAQAKIDTITKKLNDDNQAYQTTYEAFNKRLEEVKQNQKTSDTGITALDAQSSALGEKYQTYQKSVDQLNTTLSDLKLVDCVQDPDSFKSTLDDARAQFKARQTSRQDMSKFAKESVTATLKSLKVSTGEKQ